jgi:hypothetical protein
MRLAPFERGQIVHERAHRGNAQTNCARSICLIWLVMIIGCRTVPELPPVDPSQPGWQMRQGQAVWRPNTNAPELAGELIWATHADGRFMLQFLKTPIVMVEAQGGDEAWQISFPARERTIRGSRGRLPSQRLGWLYLAKALHGETLTAPSTFTRSGNKWIFANARTGEMIEGYLAP